MAFKQVVETSVANNNPSRDSNHPDNHFQSRYVPPGFKPFSYNEMCNIAPVCLQNFFGAIYQKRWRVLHHGFQTLRNSWKHDAEGGVLLSFRCVWNPWWNTNPEVLTCLLYWNNKTFWNHRSRQLYIFSLYRKNTFTRLINCFCYVVKVRTLVKKWRGLEIWKPYAREKSYWRKLSPRQRDVRANGPCRFLVNGNLLGQLIYPNARGLFKDFEWVT